MPTGRGVGSCSQQIQRIFAVQDLLETLAHEDELLDRRLVLDPEHQLTHMLKAEHRHWSVKETVLKQEQGLEFGGEVDRLAGCDGHHALCDLVANVAQGVGVEFDTVAPTSVCAMRQLMQMGFLSVVE
jgi:hypothetical protein